MNDAAPGKINKKKCMIAIKIQNMSSSINYDI